ncbi:ATP-binding protein [Shewanella nanhaiensis]|uniref:MCP four helix bundle domain-containing protein n=1 Tax=Shewanella nanhaiensis TaxID=2864872 RepID=A0ABS7EAE5_9GAMM|nr:ATP-binding protein [Shewanella nanhaiensis]MBW8186621.1 MCP four helix bundle domain-containing protein [Shewanella nanhaiensis]
MQFLRGISLFVFKNKVVLASSITLLSFIIIGAFTTYSLLKLKQEFESLFTISELRTRVIFQAHNSVLNMESELIKLVIADEKKQIRKSSIASIRATALLDESLQQLQLELPNNQTVNTLSKNLNEIKPFRMKIIGLAKSNRDQEALKIIDDIAPITDVIGKDLDKIIIQDRKELNLLFNDYKDSEINILLIFSSIIALAVILLIVANANLQKTKMALNKLNHQLEHKVKSRTEQLERSYNEIENTLEQLKVTQSQLIESEKMASLGGLVTGISHELNTPIGVCITSGSFLTDSTTIFEQRFLEGLIDENDCQEYIEVNKESMALILSNLNKCSELIQYFKKISTEQSSEKPQLFYIKQYIDEAVLYTRTHFKETHSNIKVNCSDTLQVKLVIGVLNEIIMNLVMNSLQHGYDKTLDEAVEVNIEVSKDDNRVKIRYWDSGKGINEADIDKAFEPFYTTKRGEGRNGLGLTIVYNLVRHSLNGTIECLYNESDQMQFVIEFPDNL